MTPGSQIRERAFDRSARPVSPAALAGIAKEQHALALLRDVTDRLVGEAELGKRDHVQFLRRPRIDALDATDLRDQVDSRALRIGAGLRWRRRSRSS